MRVLVKQVDISSRPQYNQGTWPGSTPQHRRLGRHYDGRTTGLRFRWYDTHSSRITFSTYLATTRNIQGRAFYHWIGYRAFSCCERPPGREQISINKRYQRPRDGFCQYNNRSESSVGNCSAWTRCDLDWLKYQRSSNSSTRLSYGNISFRTISSERIRFGGLAV